MLTLQQKYFGLTLVLPWFQPPSSPAITQAEAEQLLGPCHPHMLSVTLLRDRMCRGAPTTPPPSYLHSQLWTREPRGKAICLSSNRCRRSTSQRRKVLWQLLNFINNPLVGSSYPKVTYWKCIYKACGSSISLSVLLSMGKAGKMLAVSSWCVWCWENASEFPSSPPALSLFQWLSSKTLSPQAGKLSRCKMAPSAQRSGLAWEYSIKGHRIFCGWQARGCSLNTPSQRVLGRKILNLDISVCLWTAQTSSNVDSLCPLLFSSPRVSRLEVTYARGTPRAPTGKKSCCGYPCAILES